MEEFGSVKERKQGLVPYLSQTGAWALSIGTAIGWGSFVLTSNIYLASAGPLGSTLGMLVGMIMSSAMSAILVYATELLPGNIGMVSGAFFGLSFGLGGIGSALFGWLADVSSIQYVFQLTAFLPLLGVVTYFLPDIKD